MRALWFVYSFIIAGSVALGAPGARAVPVKPQPPSCWLADAGECVVQAPYRGIQFLPSRTGPLLALWSAEQFGKIPDGVEFVPFPNMPASLRIEASAQVLAYVKTRMLTPADGLVVIAELARLTGRDYQVPANLKTLLFAIGFPPEAVIAAEDYSDLFRVHLQLELGVSQPTAVFLNRVLGLRSVADEIREVPETKAEAPEQNAEPSSRESGQSGQERAQDTGELNEDSTSEGTKAEASDTSIGVNPAPTGTAPAPDSASALINNDAEKNLHEGESAAPKAHDPAPTREPEDSDEPRWIPQEDRFESPEIDGADHHLVMRPAF